MKKKFYCPLSPSIAWHWGFKYTSCPLDVMEQDFQACVDCPLHTDAGQKIKKKKKQEKKKKERKSTATVVVEKGKTYVSP